MRWICWLHEKYLLSYRKALSTVLLRHSSIETTRDEQHFLLYFFRHSNNDRIVFMRSLSMNLSREEREMGIRACFSMTIEDIAERKSRMRKTLILPKGRLFHLGNNERCAYSISFLCLHFRVPRSNSVFFPSCPLRARPIPRGPRTYRSCSDLQSRSTS